MDPTVNDDRIFLGGGGVLTIHIIFLRKKKEKKKKKAGHFDAKKVHIFMTDLQNLLQELSQSILKSRT